MLLEKIIRKSFPNEMPYDDAAQLWMAKPLSVSFEPTKIKLSYPRLSALSAVYSE